MSAGAVAGPDGKLRCPWGLSTDDYVTYHDEEWGRPVHGDQDLFERLSLEAFQSGLSWITILRRRAGFRTAFADFKIDAVAAFTDESTALSKALKKRGLRFVGPTTAYALMQACGLVDDHLETCVARSAP